MNARVNILVLVENWLTFTALFQGKQQMFKITAGPFHIPSILNKKYTIAQNSFLK